MEELIEKYPYIKALKHPLDNQQLQVCCRTENTVVAAGAGSGKTQVLATRFAWLVMEEDIPASAILTLTFTKKAAAEMYARIYETLKKFAYDKSVVIGEKQRKNAEKALKEFSTVHIQTLDSYCGGIVRQAANRYGISPDFSTGTSDAKSNIKNMALPFILKNKNNPGIQYYCDAAGLQTFAEDTFAEIISKHTSLATPDDYFVDSLKYQSGIICNAWNEKIKAVQNAINDINSAYNAIDGDYILASKYKGNFQELEKLLEIEAPEFNEISDTSFIDKNDKNYLDYIKTVDSYLDLWRNFSVADRCNGGKELKAIVNSFKEDVLSVINSIIGFINDYPYTKELCILLDQFCSSVNKLKRTSGALEFADVTELALRILIEQKDIRKQEKEAFSKIMIDEFQDNNGKNRDLLFILSEMEGEADFVYSENALDILHQNLKSRIVKDKLFFVGDEKQSIYKFRGADVSVFNELKTDLAAINGPESFKPMYYNYRSEPELLSSFNIMFGGHQIEDGTYKDSELEAVFPKKTEHSFEALYPLSAVAKYVDKNHVEQPAVELTEHNVKTHLQYFVEGEAFKTAEEKNLVLSSENQIPYAIAKQIHELHIQKNVPYSKIAILDKSRSKRKYLTPWLERFNIPYNLDSQSDLFADAPVNDIYNFLRLCVYPSDINAYSAFICSPLVGLTEQNLETILSNCIDFRDSDYTFQAFNPLEEEKILTALGKDSVEGDRYVKAREFFNTQQTKVLSQPITETLNTLWYDCGYRYETILNINVNSFEEQYDLLFEIARTADETGKGISWFIDELSVQKKNESSSFASDDTELNTKEVTYPLERDSAVQIMTIHKSKGLQFEYVFVTGCITKGKNETENNYYFDEGLGVTFKPADGASNFFFKKIKEVNEAKQTAELRRVIYVAATRAIKELFIIGKWGVTKEGKHSGKTESLFDPIVENFYPDLVVGDWTKKYVSGAPFDVEKLEIAPISVYKDFAEAANINSIRAEKIQEADKWMDSVPVITTPVLESNRISPSSLELEYNQELSAVLASQQSDLNDLYPEIDKIIEKPDTNFGFAEFGTLVHFYLEETINGVEAEQIKYDCGSMFKKLDEKNIQIIDELCKKVCSSFMNTEWGKKIQVAKEAGRKVRSEHGFKTFKDGNIITGSIDLYIENEDGSFTIIDYKTDHVINEETYKEQQLCYKEAVCNLYNVPEDKVNCILYYIRYNLFRNVG